MSLKTGTRLKVSSDRLREPGNGLGTPGHKTRDLYTTPTLKILAHLDLCTDSKLALLELNPIFRSQGIYK